MKLKEISCTTLTVQKHHRNWQLFQQFRLKVIRSSTQPSRSFTQDSVPCAHECLTCLIRELTLNVKIQIVTLNTVISGEMLFQILSCSQKTYRITWGVLSISLRKQLFISCLHFLGKRFNTENTAQNSTKLARQCFKTLYSPTYTASSLQSSLQIHN